MYCIYIYIMNGRNSSSVSDVLRSSSFFISMSSRVMRRGSKTSALTTALNDVFGLDDRISFSDVTGFL